MEMLPTSFSDLKRCLLKLAELAKPELMNGLEMCEFIPHSDEQDILSANQYAERELESFTESEQAPFTDSITEAEEEPQILPLAVQALACDEFSQCLLKVARALRPELAECLEQYGNCDQYTPVPPTYPSTRHSKPARSSKSPLIPQPSIKPSVLPGKPHLKFCLLKLIQRFDPELAECLKEYP